jgi:hypothetical protein
MAAIGRHGRRPPLCLEEEENHARFVSKPLVSLVISELSNVS